MRFDVKALVDDTDVGTITSAVQALDAAATVKADLEARRIEVDSDVLATPKILEAIAAAGYAASEVV
jgi:copper chaperone CopZ